MKPKPRNGDGMAWRHRPGCPQPQYHGGGYSCDCSWRQAELPEEPTPINGQAVHTDLSERGPR